mmetsp:Transcript_85891/g.152137  ORF Transcript_85891/g.152137 Transcript_85891/m.152137 type:complete len:363 (-) Transcript_85891:101-1189(-)
MAAKNLRPPDLLQHGARAKRKALAAAVQLAKDVRTEIGRAGDGNVVVLPDVRSEDKEHSIRGRFGMGDAAAKATLLAVQARLSMAGAVMRPGKHQSRKRLIVEAGPSMQNPSSEPAQHEVEAAVALKAKAAIHGARAVLAARKAVAQAAKVRASKVQRPLSADKQLRAQRRPKQLHAQPCSQAASTASRRLSRRLRVKTSRPSIGPKEIASNARRNAPLKRSCKEVCKEVVAGDAPCPYGKDGQPGSGKRHCHRGVDDVSAAAKELAAELKAALDESIDELNITSLQKQRQQMLAVKRKFHCGSESAAKITLLARARLSMAGLRAKALPHRQVVYLNPTRAQRGAPLRRCRAKTPSAEACTK